MGELVSFPMSQQKQDRFESRKFKSNTRRYGVLCNTVPVIIVLDAGEEAGEFIKEFERLSEAAEYSNKVLEILVTLAKYSATKPLTLADAKRFDGGKLQTFEIQKMIKAGWGDDEKGD